jgi:cell division protein ZapA (FtsZ GTPase activity inhibitor)
MEGKLCLDILGTSFSITADEDSGRLETIFEQYRKAVALTQQTTGLKDPLKIAILTGFILCDDMYKLQNSNNSGNPEAEEAEHITLQLIDRINELLENTPSPSAAPPQNGAPNPLHG